MRSDYVLKYANAIIGRSSSFDKLRKLAKRTFREKSNGQILTLNKQNLPKGFCVEENKQ